MTAKYLAILVGALVLAGLTGCATTQNLLSTSDASAASVPARAEDVKPLRLGSVAPTAKLAAADTSTVDLAKVFHQQPTMLIFYRGGWCPYCNKHLDEVAKALPELQQLGYRVLAISPDRPEELQKTVVKHSLQYTLLSDKNGALIRAYGLAFKVDADTLEKMKGYGIDLDAATGNSRHELPVPAVYLVDAKGVIRFVHYDPDYKQRLSADELLAAARQASGK